MVTNNVVTGGRGVVMDWYGEYIEPEVRDLVKYLRNNGVNTECSCGHEGYVQCQHIIDGEIKRIHDLMYYYCDENKLPIDYEIVARVQVTGGFVYPSVDIKITKIRSTPAEMKDRP